MPNVPDDLQTCRLLSADETDVFFDPVNRFSKIALAVSGGADSICLLLAFHDWHRRNAWPGDCEVLTVDHGLRVESASETEFVRSLSQDLGYHCEILSWGGEKPKTNVQEKARRERYRLMAERMRASETDVLLLAHHADDQAETFLDRLTRGSGVYGLSAMALEEMNGPEGLHLLRPFLSIPKSRLESHLKRLGQTWHEDPSNTSSKYKRSRLRALSSILSDEGLTRKRILQTADNMRRARSAFEMLIRELFNAHVEDHPAGPLRLPFSVFVRQPEEIQLRLLATLIERVTGQEQLLRLPKLIALNKSIRDKSKTRQTLGGAVVDRNAEFLTVWKEVGREPPPTIALNTSTLSWDDRFQIDLRSQVFDEALELGPICSAPVTLADFAFPSDWPKEAFFCAPVVWSSSRNLLFCPLPGVESEKLEGRSDVISVARMPISFQMAGNYSDDLR